MSFADDFTANTNALLSATRPASVASPFQVYDVTNLGLGQDVQWTNPITTAAADLPSTGQGATNATAAASGISAVISNYFSRTIIIILGFIFVGAGLTMFKKG